jgi:hypothetical protein
LFAISRHHHLAWTSHGGVVRLGRGFSRSIVQAVAIQTDGKAAAGLAFGYDFGLVRPESEALIAASTHV